MVLHRIKHARRQGWLVDGRRRWATTQRNNYVSSALVVLTVAAHQGSQVIDLRGGRSPPRRSSTTRGGLSPPTADAVDRPGSSTSSRRGFCKRQTLERSRRRCRNYDRPSGASICASETHPLPLITPGAMRITGRLPPGVVMRTRGTQVIRPQCAYPPGACLREGARDVAVHIVRQRCRCTNGAASARQSGVSASLQDGHQRRTPHWVHSLWTTVCNPFWGNENWRRHPRLEPCTLQIF